MTTHAEAKQEIVDWLTKIITENGFELTDQNFYDACCGLYDAWKEEPDAPGKSTFMMVLSGLKLTYFLRLQTARLIPSV